MGLRISEGVVGAVREPPPKIPGSPQFILTRLAPLAGIQFKGGGGQNPIHLHAGVVRDEVIATAFEKFLLGRQPGFFVYPELDFGNLRGDVGFAGHEFQQHGGVAFQIFFLKILHIVGFLQFAGIRAEAQKQELLHQIAFLFQVVFLNLVDLGKIDFAFVLLEEEDLALGLLDVNANFRASCPCGRRAGPIPLTCRRPAR